MYLKERFMYTLTSLTTSCVTGEALGAIGSPEVLDILKTYSKDSVVEVLSLFLSAVVRFYGVLIIITSCFGTTCIIYICQKPSSFQRKAKLNDRWALKASNICIKSSEYV